MSSKHKSEDYKLSVVKYYLRANKTQEEVCKIFECSPRSLMRWVKRYNKEKSIKKHNSKPISYKITKEQVKYAILKLKENEHITMKKLHKIVKKKYKNFDITPQHLGLLIK